MHLSQHQAWLNAHELLSLLSLLGAARVLKKNNLPMPLTSLGRLNKETKPHVTTKILTSNQQIQCLKRLGLLILNPVINL